ncbi:hypothetical protein V1264_000523 [Littorina saxatilis]|uniref:Chitin-binding type-2 domain-containing protein n=2 Tax=Littorina saxatilis TaxID=31220 RepID=A0AAN9GMV7_9CAEN
MVVVVATTSPATATSAPDSRCGVDNGLVADESSCRGFMICLKGRVRKLDCSRDLLFNRNRSTCDFPSNVDCDTRPKDSDGSSCYTAMVNVTVTIRNEVKDPEFQGKIRVHAPRQPLRYILLIAAGQDTKFRFETQHFDGYGDYVSTINGMSNDVSDVLAVWQPYDKHGDVISESLDNFVPENDEVVTFVYTAALG